MTTFGVENKIKMPKCVKLFILHTEYFYCGRTPFSSTHFFLGASRSEKHPFSDTRKKSWLKGGMASLYISHRIMIKRSMTSGINLILIGIHMENFWN